MLPIQSCFGSTKLFPKPAPQSCSPKPFPKLVIESCSEQLLSLPPKVVSKSGFPKLLAKKLLPKAIVLQGNCSSILLQSRNVAPHSCSPKLLFKVAIESRVKKQLPKLQSCCPKLPQSWSGKLPNAAPQSCAPKLFSKAVALKLRFCKPVHQNGSPKPFCKAAPESCAKVATKSCSPKLLSKTIAPKLRFFKPLPQNGSPTLFCKAAPKSCSQKLLLKAAPRSCKAAPESCCCSSKQLFLKVVPDSLPKLLPKAVPRSCFPKLLPKAPLQSGCPKQLCFKPVPQSVPQSYSPKRLPKVAAESCSPKFRSIVLKYSPQRRSPKLRFFKAAVQSC